PVAVGPVTTRSISLAVALSTISPSRVTLDDVPPGNGSLSLTVIPQSGVTVYVATRVFMVKPPADLEAKKLPIPSAKIRPTAENTSRLARPVMRLPKGVLLPVTAAVVPGAVAGSGTKGAAPAVPGAVAPSRKNPDLEPTKPY